MIDPDLQFAVDLRDYNNAVELDGIRYRRLDARTDVPAVCELFETVFHQSMTPSYWQWKYLQGPGACSFSLVVEHMETERMIGHMGVLVLPGIRDGKALRMGQVCDVMLHPEYRAGIGSQSTYLRMNRALQQLAHAPQMEDLPPLYMYGFPGLRPANLGERMGVYRRLQICTEYTSVPDLLEVNPLQGLWHCLDAEQPSDTPLDEIWQRHSQALFRHADLRQTPHIVKNAAYLRWRYWSHPHQQLADAPPLYRTWLLVKDGTPMGWVVSRMQPQPIVVDSCLPHQWLEAALCALPVPDNGRGKGWASWLAQSRAPSVVTPIHAVEVLGQPFHTNWPSPRFQPGDTDIF